MPRSGNVYSPPAGTKGTPNTTIESSKYNAFVDDLTTDANAARPITAGGTGATNASQARQNLGADNADNLASGTVNDARLPATMSGKTFTSAIAVKNAADRIIEFRDAAGVLRGRLVHGQTAGALYLQIYDGTGTLLKQLFMPPTGSMQWDGQDVWTAGNDGAGSGLDADILDGQQGAWYADIPSRLGYTPVNAATYTAADVLAKIKTVDGAGSGLDADLLQGLPPNTSNVPNTVASRDSVGNTAFRDVYLDRGDGTAFLGFAGGKGILSDSTNGLTALGKDSFTLASGGAFYGDGNVKFTGSTQTAFGNFLSDALNARPPAQNIGTGGIGSYVYGQRVGGTFGLNPGDLVSGANVSPASGSTSTGGTFAGTWRCMGLIGAGATTGGAFTLFLRVS